MKNLTVSKLAIAISVGLTALAVAFPASAAYYLDQQGQPIYYDTYTVQRSQYYPVQYNYNGYGSQAVVYGGSYGYNNYSGSNYNNSINRPPVIFSTPVRDAIDGNTYVAGINATDPDHDQIFYQLISGPVGMTIDSATGLIRWSGTSGKIGQSFPVVVGATDGRSPVVTQSYTITVRQYGYGGATGNSSGSNSINPNSNEKTTGYSGSALGAFFGGKKTPKEITFSNINVISGPKNINDREDRNCEVLVNWQTSVATVGQVMYGPTSQPLNDSFQYAASAPEGNSYQKNHQVKLGCLENKTYFFRIGAFSTDATANSGEQMILPFTVRTQIPTTVGSDSGVGSVLATTVGSTSLLGQLGRLLNQPVLWILLIVAVLGYIGYRILRHFNVDRPANWKAQKQPVPAAAVASAGYIDHGAPGEIPMLSVPHQ